MKWHMNAASLVKTVVTLFTFIVSFSSYAALTTVSTIIDANNDCGNSGYFNYDGNGFSNCTILIRNGSGEVANVTLSNVIIKFNGSLESSEISSNYPNVDPDAYSFSNLSSGNKSGSWSNTTVSPGIKFWVAKAGSGKHGSGLHLFWQVDSNNIPSTCTAGESASNFTIECLNLAQVVTSGSWTTPGDKGLSHLTFFGGICTENCEPPPPSPIPEPGTIFILASAIIGLGAMRKRKF